MSCWRLAIALLALAPGCASAPAPSPGETITLRNSATRATVTCGPYMIRRIEREIAALDTPMSRMGNAIQGPDTRSVQTLHGLVEQLRRERESRDRCLGQYVPAGYQVVSP